jgi:hypothetical protein
VTAAVPPGLALQFRDWPGLLRPLHTTNKPQSTFCHRPALPTSSRQSANLHAQLPCARLHNISTACPFSHCPCTRERLPLWVLRCASFPNTSSYFLFPSYARDLQVRKRQPIDKRAAEMARTNGRQASETPSSSSSDFYMAHASELAYAAEMASKFTKTHPTPTNGTNIPRKAAQQQPLLAAGGDGDSSSEMDVSDSSSSIGSADLNTWPTRAGAKRKLSETDLEDACVSATAQEVAKKPRVSVPLARPNPSLLMAAGWPPELWQQVFMHLSPAMLSRCLRVCRSFNFCLTKLKATNIPRKKNTPIARVLDSEALWTESRRHTYPTMPRPMLGSTELQMLQLIGALSCQSCGKPHVRLPVTNFFSAGPGENGVRVIWPFRARLCGKCFVSESLTVRNVRPNLM